MVQSKFNVKIATLRCDNGREYISDKLKEFCRNNGTVIDYTVPYTPELNGKAERLNRTLVEKARSMAYEAGMPKEFWNEAVHVAAYLYNRSPTSSNEKNVTSAEIWYNRKPEVSNLRVLRELRTKFDFKSEKCIMMGYTNTGYRLWSLEKQKIIISRDVAFNENEFYYKRINVAIVERNEDEENNNENKVDNDNEEIGSVKENITEDVGRKIGQRTIKLPQKYDEYEMFMAFDVFYRKSSAKRL